MVIRESAPAGDAAGAYYDAVPQANCKPINKFQPDVGDFIFAIIAFVLGYLFACWVFYAWRGWGVSAFTTAYLLAVTLYLTRKHVFTANAATWFWLIATWVTGATYSLWENAGFTAIRALFLFCSAVYYVIVASGRTLMGETGNYLIADGFNALIVIPFRNFINQYVSFSVLGKGNKRGKVFPVILGALLALMLLTILIPMLKQADSGGFGMILNSIKDAFAFLNADNILYVILAIPVAAYLYGLVSGAAHGKGTDIITQEPVEKAVAAMRVIPAATINILLGAACLIYAVFILSQIPYFFSAFTGRRPEGWLLYADYARQGFFELCGIAAINLGLLTAGNLTSRKHRGESKPLKIFNIVLALITLVLIATALSKMALYISAYGLTMPRLLPCVFMVFLAIVFVALIAMQRYEFPIVRFSLITGAVMLCILCLGNPDALVVRYNTDRYLSGTLPIYDTEILYRSGSAGIEPAIKVYEATQDGNLKSEIANYLNSHILYAEPGHTLCLEDFRLNERIRSAGRG